MTLSQINMILAFCEIPPLAAFTFVIFGNHNKLWHPILKLCCSAALLIINAIQLPIEISLEMPYGLTIALVAIWAMNSIFAICSIVEYKKNHPRVHKDIDH
ncbi:MAG: hypothetical protein IKJ32_01310 [Clostridia bacterium]|nr:hypothetical protein [Clostridia bacterium]